jgi:drug/metabolite transporter (DMT)-like permease
MSYLPTAAKKQGLAIFSLLLVTIAWGAVFTMVKWTIAGMDLYYFLFLRFLLASAVLAVIFHRRLRRLDWQTVKAAALLGIFLAIAYASHTEGLRFTTASNSAFITCLYIVVVPFFAVLLYKEKIKPSSIIGLVVSVVGLYLLTQFSLAGINRGDYITLICSLTYALHIVFTRIMVLRHDVVSLVTLQLFFAALFFGVIAGIKGSFTLNITPIGIVTLLVSALICSALAFLVQSYVQRIVSATRVGLIITLEAPFGAFFGWWWAGEMFTDVSFIGALVMLLGVLVSEAGILSGFGKKWMPAVLKKAD